MKIAPLPFNENERLKELEQLNLLDSIEEKEYDSITKLAASICQTPIALVSLIDKDRQWFKSHHGLEATETARDLAFCAHAILQDDVFVVEDASQDERFHDNPLVTGEPHVVFYVGVPLKTKRGSNVGTLCIIDQKARRITEQQQESLKILANQVVELFELRRLNNYLEKLSKTRMHFLSVINHEMRTPLNIIMGYLDLIFEDASDRQDQGIIDSCNHARTAGEQLLEMIKDMIDQVSLDSGDLKFSKQSYEINTLIKKVVKSCAPLEKIKNTKFEIKDTKDLQLEIDPNRFQQIIQNLISNAAKYAQANSTVSIEVDQTSPDSVYIRVKNFGNDIKPEVATHIFDRFYRSPEFKGATIPGFGLGLPISKRLAELHGGDLVLESSVNGMTSFLLTLPR